MIGMFPKDAIRSKEVPLLENYPPEDTWPEAGFYCYLLRPGEKHDDQQKSNG